MRFIPSCLLLLLLVGSLSLVHGILEYPYSNFRCRCNKVTDVMPKVSMVVRVKTFPRGNGCPHSEIIVFLKNNTTQCLDPKSPEIPKFFKDLWRRRRALRKTTPAKRTQKA